VSSCACEGAFQGGSLIFSSILTVVKEEWMEKSQVGCSIEGTNSLD
jgi:hypothetical protein